MKTVRKALAAAMIAGAAASTLTAISPAHAAMTQLSTTTYVYYSTYEKNPEQIVGMRQTSDCYEDYQLGTITRWYDVTVEAC